jgi:hypothetical protein
MAVAPLAAAPDTPLLAGRPLPGPPVGELVGITDFEAAEGRVVAT